MKTNNDWRNVTWEASNLSKYILNNLSNVAVRLKYFNFFTDSNGRIFLWTCNDFDSYSRKLEWKEMNEFCLKESLLMQLQNENNNSYNYNYSLFYKCC